jgi:hypothetical protein
MLKRHKDILRKLQDQLDKVRSAAKAQRQFGNEDTAEYFDQVAADSERLISEVTELLRRKPDSTEAEVRQFLERYYKS